jgi:hypothetical protein
LLPAGQAAFRLCTKALTPALACWVRAAISAEPADGLEAGAAEDGEFAADDVEEDGVDEDAAEEDGA